jgi:pilus assembly protein CpaB
VKSRLLAGAAAVVLALVGAMLVISYAQGADQRAVKDLSPWTSSSSRLRFPPALPLNPWLLPSPPSRCQRRPSPGPRLKSLDSSKGKVAGVRPGTRRAAGCRAPGRARRRQSRRLCEHPSRLQEVSFKLEPDRVVGGRLAPGDHVGVFVNLDKGGAGGQD